MPGALLVASFVIAGCGDGNGAARSSGDVTVNIVNDDGTSTTTAVDLSGTGLAR
ncbi:MAG: hypothetical protein AAF997_16175 [Myxococcota bacterium]